MSNDKDFKVKNGIQPASYQEGLGTIATGSVLSIPSMSASGNTLSVASQDSNPQGITLKPDGSRFFVIGNATNAIYQYTMSTNYDLSTASYDSVSFSFSSQTTNIRDLTVSTNGLNLYVLDATSNVAYQYALSTAWDLSTASYASKSFSFATQDTGPVGLSISSTGAYMYMGGSTNDTIYQYSLSTAYDISTASYDNNSYSVGVGDPDAVYISSDGKTLVCGQSTDDVTSLSLSTPYDLSTATASGSYSAGSDFDTLRGLSVDESTNKIYIVSNGDDLVTEYTASTSTATLDLSTGSVFEITPTSNIQVGLSNPAASGTVSQGTLLLDGAGTTGYDLANGAYSNKSFSLTAQESVPTGLFFKADGTKMYVVGSNGAEVNEFNLSTAWDVLTATYVQNFSVSAQEATPQDLFFKPDGTKMYVAGNTGDDINEYDLSTAWDISTATFLQSFSVAAQDTQLRGLFFKPDGLKMYVAGNTGDDINEYNLSTAWNVSTATFVQAFSISSQDTSPQAVFFKPDGTKMYVIGGVGVDINEYNLSTAWNVSTASYVQAFSVSSEETVPLGLFFKPDGYAMYIVGAANDTVYQYSTATPATITYNSAIQFGGGTAPDSPAIGETDVLTFSTRDGGTSYQAMQAIDGAK